MTGERIASRGFQIRDTADCKSALRGGRRADALIAVRQCHRFRLVGVLRQHPRLATAARGAFNMSATGCPFCNLESGNLHLRLNGESNPHECSSAAKEKAGPKILF